MMVAHPDVIALMVVAEQITCDTGGSKLILLNEHEQTTTNNILCLSSVNSSITSMLSPRAPLKKWCTFALKRQLLSLVVWMWPYSWASLPLTCGLRHQTFKNRSVWPLFCRLEPKMASLPLSTAAHSSHVNLPLANWLYCFVPEA